MSSHLERIITLSPVEARAGVKVRLQNSVFKKCLMCRGESLLCENCEGEGVITAHEEIDADIKPINFENFTEKKITYEGLGNYSTTLKSRGNLVLLVKVEDIVVDDRDEFVVLEYGELEKFHELLDEEQMRIANFLSGVGAGDDQRWLFDDFDLTFSSELENPENEPKNNEGANSIFQRFLQMAEIDVYQNNPFRILGVLPGLTEREQKRTVEKIIKICKVSENYTPSSSILPIQNLKLEDLEAASRKLQDPEKQFLEEFLWYYPSSITDEIDDGNILAALEKDDLELAVSLIKSEIFDEEENYLPLQDPYGRKLHNLAVLSHLKCLEKEGGWEDWEECRQWWDELIENDRFWNFLNDVRIKQIDNPLIRNSTIRQLRNTLSRFYRTINAKLALNFIQSGNQIAADAHVAMVFDAWDNTAQGEEIVLEMVHAQTTKLENIIEIFNSETNNSNTIERFLDKAWMPLKALEIFLDPDDPTLNKFRDRTLFLARDATVDFANETKNYRAALKIYEKFRFFEPSAEQRKKFSDDEIAVTDLLFESEIEPLCAKASQACDEDSTRTPTIVTNFLSGGVGLINSIKLDENEKVKWFDSVVRLSRSLMIEYSEKTQNWNECLLFQAKFLELPISRELIKELGEDKITLTRLVHQKETEEILDNAIKISKEKPATTPDLIRLMISECQAIIDKKSAIFTSEHEIIKNLRNSVFQVSFGMLIDHVNKTEEFGRTLEVLKLLKPFALDNEQRNKLDENLEILQRNAEFYRDNVLCWFCHENKGENASNITVTMHGNVNRERFLNRTRVTWQNVEVTVPRCISCYSIHTQKSSALWKGVGLGFLVGVLLNIPLFFLYADSIKELSFLLGLLTIAGFAGLGYDISKQFFIVQQTRQIADYSDKNYHPKIKELQRANWSIGRQP